MADGISKGSFCCEASSPGQHRCPLNFAERKPLLILNYGNHNPISIYRSRLLMKTTATHGLVVSLSARASAFVLACQFRSERTLP
jgi:hypothetical protein